MKKYIVFLIKKHVLVTFLGLAINLSGLNASGYLDWNKTKQIVEVAKLPYNLVKMYKNKLLIQAVENNSLAGVRLALLAGADVNAVNNDGRTALMDAVLSGSKEIVELLLNAGGDANRADDDDITILMSAACSGSKEIVELLLKAGANVNAVENDDCTALMEAVRSGSRVYGEYKEIVELLLKAGADVNAIDSYGGTALMDAASSGSKETVELLLQAGARVNAVDDNGSTALIGAAGLGSKEIVKLLLEAGADANAVSDGWTAFMFAARSESKEIVELLLQAGADVNTVNGNGWTVLMSAACSESKEIVELLLKAGANVNAVSGDGWTAISLADTPEIKQFLMRYKAFKFVKIDQKFDKEPKPEDYIVDKAIPVGTSGENILSMLGQDDEAYGEQIEAFTKAHADYLHSKLQEAYKPFLYENNSKPLIKFFEEIQVGLLPEVVSFFNSREDLLYVLNELKSDATGQALNRLQKMIDLEEHIEKDIAARKIQNVFRRHRQR